MARRLLPAISVMSAIALVAGAWATGGLGAAPRPRPRAPGSLIDLGRYQTRVTGSVLHRGGTKVVALDVTLWVRSQDTRSVLLEDFAVNALSLDSAGGPPLVPASAQAFSQGSEVNMLNPGVPVKVVLRYLTRHGAVPPPGFHARLALWGYDHREDFFYGHVQWKPRKPVDATADQPAEYAVALPIRREGL